MSFLTVLIMTMTLIMTFVMVPKIYWAWLRAEHFFSEKELPKLRLLQVEQNEWVRLHVGCGSAVVVVAWLVRAFAPEVPESTVAILALYAGTSFFFAVVESMLAQKIENMSSTIPAPAPAKQR